MNRSDAGHSAGESNCAQLLGMSEIGGVGGLDVSTGTRIQAMKSFCSCSCASGGEIYRTAAQNLIGCLNIFKALDI